MLESMYMSQGPPAVTLQEASSDMNHPAEGFIQQQRPEPASPFTREQHMLMVQELNRVRNGSRSPRRSQTLHEQIPAGQYFTIQNMRPAPPVPARTPPVPPADVSPATTPLASESQTVASASVSVQPATPPQEEQRTLPRRPKLGAPRRSYSVMDYEPVPPEQRPSSTLTLQELPGELHFAIFDWLDPIDSTCLGLTNKHFYNVHRRMHGTVPLSIRRSGPNDLEWAWRLASGLWSPHSKTPEPPLSPGLEEDKHQLAALRVKGRGLCRKCGISRCELHKHIQDWMPENYEYCSVRDKFVPRAPETAKDQCYMNNPKDPHRCGRHRVRAAKPAAV